MATREWILSAIQRSIVEVTAAPAYLEAVHRVFDQCEVFLVSGERSHAQWDVPPWALTKSKQTVTIAGTGHLMMLERPTRFIETLEDILS